MTEQTAALPKFFKDEEGFCYVATATLAGQPGMAPWDGAVNALGFAVVESADDAPTPRARPRGKTPAKTPTGE